MDPSCLLCFSQMFYYVIYMPKLLNKNKTLALFAKENMFSSRFCFFSFLPVLPKPQVSYKTTSPGVIEANCTSVSRPPAEIVWNVERDNRTMGAPVATHLPQGDGTTLVISTLMVRSGLLKDVSVKCLVHHKGLETPIAVSMNTKSELASPHQQTYRADACYSFYCQ